MSTYPLIIEADELEQRLGETDQLIVDLCKRETYSNYHIPGAIHFDYTHIVKVDKPVMGRIPDDQQLISLFSALGISSQTQVIAYDDEGGGKAGRFLWTLEYAGHKKVSLLNGGIFAWANESHPLSKQPVEPVAAEFKLDKDETRLATLESIRSNPGSNIQLLDARSLAEYRGTKTFALKGGHIPGAIHYEWTEAMDRNNNLRIINSKLLSETLENKGFDKDKTTIVYCHSHHRSAFSYYLLRSAGFNDVCAYAGSWSEWGNHPETPVSS